MLSYDSIDREADLIRHRQRNSRRLIYVKLQAEEAQVALLCGYVLITFF